MAYFERYASDALSLLMEKKSIPQNGAMLALFISPSAGLHLFVPGGEQINQLHITLVSFGEAENLSEALFAAGASPKMLRTMCTRIASEFYSLSGQVAGVGCFTANQNERPFLALVDIPELGKLHHRICHMLKEMGITWQINHGYTPHITLKYLEQGETFPFTSLPSIPLEFTGFTLAIGERRYFFPFGEREKKHLPGEHDQENHANRTGGIDMQSEFNRLQTLSEKTKYLKEAGKAWRDNLSGDDEEAYEDYTGAGYLSINGSLRSGKEFSPGEKFVAETLNETLHKSSAPSDMIVYRGLSKKILSNLQVGDEIHDKAFVSTTIDKEMALKEFGISKVFASIGIPKGSPGAYIDPLSVNTGEREWLLPSNARFKVLSITPAPYNTTHVSLLYMGSAKNETGRVIVSNKAAKDRSSYFAWDDGDVTIVSKEKKHDPGDHNQANHGHRTGGIDMQSEFNRLETVEEKGKYLQEQSADWQKGLSPKEKKAVEGYTTDGYISVNRALRREVSLTPKEQVLHDALSTALSKSSAPSDMVVYRGLSAKILQSLKKNDVIRDKAFVSTTIDKEMAFENYAIGKVLATISIPKGTPGAYVAPLSTHPDEQEWLLPSNAQFKVVQIKKGTMKTTHVSLLYMGSSEEKYIRRVLSRKNKDRSDYFSWNDDDIVITSSGTKHDPGGHDQSTHGRRYGESSDGERIQQSGEGIPEKAKGKIYMISELIHSPVVNGLQNGSLSLYKDEKESSAESALYHMQGYDGKPHVVSSIDPYVAAGEREMFRGIDNTHGDPEKLAEEYRSGDLFPGKGVFGNGTYTAYGNLAQKVVDGYAGKDGAILRMSLRPDATTIPYDALESIMIQARQTINARVKEVQQDESMTKSEQKDMIQRLDWVDQLVMNEGRLATILGYDAIDVPDRKFMVILNRTATRVEKKK